VALDLSRPDLQLLFCGYNPSLVSGRSGHHYAHPGNRFWRVLFAAGVTGRLYRPEEDARLLDLGIGFTKVSLGLVFVFGAFVSGILSPPATLVVSFGLMIPAVALIGSALQEANKRRRAVPPPPIRSGSCWLPSGITAVSSPRWKRRWRPRSP
jgi:hypothetical protein